MKLRHPIILKTAAFAGSGLLGLLRKTIDWRAVYFDPTTDPVHPLHSGRYIYLTWHESMLLPVVLRGGRRKVALASGHKDGELLARFMKHFGWSITTGSTNRGGTGALLRLLREDTRHISITPDGPRGPRRTMALGPIFLASRLGVPVVCIGCGYDRPWRARSWDRFAVPRPFSRGRAVFAPPVRVPAEADRDELEQYRQWFENLLTWATDEAERWATEGRSRPGEAVMQPRYTPSIHYAPPAPSAPPLPDHLAAQWKALTGRSLIAA